MERLEGREQRVTFALPGAEAWNAADSAHHAVLRACGRLTAGGWVAQVRRPALVRRGGPAALALISKSPFGWQVAHPVNLLLRTDLQEGAPSRLLLAGWGALFNELTSGSRIQEDLLGYNQPGDPVSSSSRIKKLSSCSPFNPERSRRVARALSRLEQDDITVIPKCVLTSINARVGVCGRIRAGALVSKRRRRSFSNLTISISAPTCPSNIARSGGSGTSFTPSSSRYVKTRTVSSTTS